MTGVQTCALPISSAAKLLHIGLQLAESGRHGIDASLLFLQFSGYDIGIGSFQHHGNTTHTFALAVMTVVAALPMAIFGILPQAVVADIAQSDAVTSGSSREGMFYAARTFAFKLGQSLSMLIFTAVSTIGAGTGTGYRIAAFGAAVFCGAGGLILMFYDEKKINCVINGKA